MPMICRAAVALTLGAAIAAALPSPAAVAAEIKVEADLGRSVLPVKEPGKVYLRLSLKSLAGARNERRTPINAAIVNCVPSNFRAFAMGLNVLFIHLLGDAISPPLIGLAGEKKTLSFAIEVNSVPVLLGGVALFFAARAAFRHLPGTTAAVAAPRG